jgi:tetratricopeptide (TPR) repeat protein
VTSAAAAQEQDSTPPAISEAPHRQPELPQENAPPAAAPKHPPQLLLPQICLSARTTPDETKALIDAAKAAPSAAYYDAVGASFAQHKLTACAASAYQLAARLDDHDWQAHFGLGQAQLIRGDKKRASDELEKAATLNPDAPAVHEALGEFFQSQDKLVQAQAEYESVMQLDAHYPYAAVHLAEVLVAQGLKDQAIAPLKKAEALQPPPDESAMIELQLGRLYAAKDSTKALASFQKSVAANPDSAEAHFELGNLYASGPHKDLDAAITEYQTALDLQPANASARLAVARALIAETRYDEAIDYLRDYLKINPRDADAYHLQASAYQSLQKWPEASDAAVAAVRLDPKNLDWRRDAASFLAEAHRYVAAQVQLQAAESLNPKIPEIHEQLIFLYRQNGQADRAKQERLQYEALEKELAQKEQARQMRLQADQMLARGSPAAAYDQYREALRLDPDSGEAHFSLALALGRLSDATDEFRELKRAVELNPQLAPAHNQLGLIYLSQGKRDEAEGEFKAAVEIDPKFAEARNNLGVLYIQQGNIREAIVMFEEAVEEQPNYAGAFVNLANALIAGGKLNDAEKRLRDALQANPKDGNLYMALGKLDAKRHRDDESLADFHQAAEFLPNSPEAHLELGRALEDHCDRRGAFENYSRAESLDPQSADARLDLGRFFYESANYDGAREHLTAALKLDPKLIEALYLLGLTEAQSNNFDVAVQLFESVTAIDPNQASAQYFLAQQFHKLGRDDDVEAQLKVAASAKPPSVQALADLVQQGVQPDAPAAVPADPQPDQSDAAPPPSYSDQLDEAIGRFVVSTGLTFDSSNPRDEKALRLEVLGLQSAGAQNWPAAINEMRDALRACEKCTIAGRLHRHLGLFYCRTGRIDLARAELRQAVALDPNDSEARHAFAALASLQ